MENHEYTIYVIQGVVLSLFLFSEYLGVTPKHKSNSILQLITCLLKRREEEDAAPAPLADDPLIMRRQ